MIQSLDTQLLYLINHGAANSLFDALMPALSDRGYLLVLPFLFGMLLRGVKHKDNRGKSHLPAAVWTFLVACSAVFLAELAEDVIKEAIARVRPCSALEGLRLIVACPGSFSMPSGHAISSFAFATPLFYLTQEYIAMPWRLYPLLLASLIAFSRLYLGVHYPTDVLAGAVLGAIIGFMLSFLYQVTVTEEFIKKGKK